MKTKESLRSIGIIAVLISLLTGCANVRSVRFTGFQLDNFTPEKMTAYRDEARVVYDRGGSELSEGHVDSKPEYEGEDDEGGTTIAQDVWAALIGILPDWNMRLTVLKLEWDVIDEVKEEEQ